MSKYRNHNIRQIKGALLRKEGSQKGTAPSFFNAESDRGKPGPVSPLSTKGYDHLDAVVRSTDNSHAKPEDASNITLSGRKIALALAHVRRTRFDYYRAVLRVENDPGAVKRWQDGRGEDAEDWLRSWERACEEAADFIEHVWPGTRLYVPNQLEEPVDTPRAGSWKRGAVVQEKRWTWEDSARSVGREIDAVRKAEGCGIEAAKGLLIDRKGYGPREVDRKWDFYRDERDGAA